VLADVLEDLAKEQGVRPADVLFPVLAHELVHAYDDQVHGVLPDPAALQLAVEDPGALTRLQALMGLLEGRATYASELACAVAGREPLPAPTLERVREAELLSGDGSLAGEMAAGLANALGRVKLLQYAHGREFARSAHARCGENGVSYMALAVLNDQRVWIVSATTQYEVMGQLKKLGCEDATIDKLETVH